MAMPGCRRWQVRGVAAVWLLAAAGAAWAWPEEGRAVLSPTLAKAAPGETVQFTATQLPGRLEMARPAHVARWSVNGIEGGSAEHGTIDGRGVYRAPRGRSGPREIHITAEVPQARNPLLFATVILGKDVPRYRLTGQWDARELEKSGIEDPRRIARDSRGDFLVAPMVTAKVLRFSGDGTYRGTFGRGPDGGETVHEGMCVVAVDPAGRVFAADRKTGPPRVDVYTPEGDWLFGFAPKGAQRHMVAEPSALAFHPDGRVFLADMDSMRVAVYDGQGKLTGLLREHGPEGNRFNAPSGLAVDPAGDLFVSSLYGPCEKVVADTGERILAFAYPDPPHGPMFIDDLCVDRWGNVYLAVRCAADLVQSGPDGGGFARVMKYTNAGDFLAAVDLPTTRAERAAVTVDEDGRLYVAYGLEKTAGVAVYTPE